ncbi:hypothetical protein, partial [Bacillus atrophaeus]|uniref:hypothetical protein n=1 Tax=Bacillus atrophaeus TaxID=1452 RepID=UPI002E158549
MGKVPKNTVESTFIIGFSDFFAVLFICKYGWIWVGMHAYGKIETINEKGAGSWILRKLWLRIKSNAPFKKENFKTCR